MQKISEYNLGHLLAQALHRWNRELIITFENNGFVDIKPSYGAIFVPLFDHEPVTIADVVIHSKLSKQVVSTYVKELVAKRYIILHPVPIDRRSLSISLTPRGRKFKNAALRTMRTMDWSVTTNLGKQNVATLIALLRRYINNN